LVFEDRQKQIGTESFVVGLREIQVIRVLHGLMLFVCKRTKLG